MIIMKKRIFCAVFILFFIGSLVIGINYQNPGLNNNSSTTKTEIDRSFNSNDIISPFPSQLQKNFTLTGQKQADTLLSFQGISSLVSNTNKDIKITTDNWNISDILVNFTDIHKESLLHIENVTPPHSFMMIYNSTKGPTINIFAMELKMPLPSFIFNLKLYLYYAGNFSLFTVIYCATSGGGGRPTPKQPGSGYSAISEYKSLMTYGSVNKTEWVEFKFNPRTLKDFLNPLNTINKSFFVVLGVIPLGAGSTPGGKGSFLHWGFNLDGVGNPNSGLVYKFSGNSWVELTNIDFLLENISYSTLTWQNIFNVESSTPSGNNYELVYLDYSLIGTIETQDNAQQFQTNVNSYLSNLSTYLQYRGQLTVWAEVYNATRSSSSNPGKPIPHKLLFKSDNISLSSASKETMEWRTFRFLTDQTLNSSFLNVQNTYNNSFFVVLKAIGLRPLIQDYVDWGFIRDSANGDQGIAYFWNQSQRPEFWGLFATPQDLCLANVSLISYEYNPSNVNLKINSTNVADYPSFKFGGFKLLSGSFDGSKGMVFLNTTANLTVYYQASWRCQYNNYTKALASFKGYSLANAIEWNVTLSTNYPVWDSSIQGSGRYFSKKINITLPTDYSINRIYFNNIPYVFWNTTRVGDKQFVVILGLTGNWFIRAYSPNYIEEVHAYYGTKELAQFYVKDNLNVTAKLKTLTNIASNLTIYNVSNKIVHNTTIVPIAYWAKFALWTIPKNDTHYLVVSWDNGTEVGIRSLEIMCVYHTRLIKNFPNANTNLGLITGTAPIKIGVFYNDTDNKVGIPYANIAVNITPFSVVEYDRLLHPGYYNLTIYTSLLINGNWTAKIQSTRRGYNTSNLFIRFELHIGINATLTVTGGCRWQVGRWWVNPDPYFDDATHKVTVFYANGTFPYEGIEYSQVVGKPNWTSALWYGTPTNASPGFYDIVMDTEGLHEGDIGRVDIIAYSLYFETKKVNVSLNVIEIPVNLLLMDAGPYENITCYEGETIDIAVGYWDDFHETPILFENPTMGNLTWQISGTAANGTLQKSVWQYEATISLPALGILGTKTYNLKIRATALRDYATYEQNLTLNVKSKENTTLVLTIIPYTEFRVGNRFNSYANLSFENKTPLVNTRVDFNITLWYQGNLKEGISDSRFTNALGIAIYSYGEIPNEIDEIRINAVYEGTPQIDPAAALQTIPIGPKYNVSLVITSELPTEVMVGDSIHLEATLSNEEKQTGLANETIEFYIIFTAFDFIKRTAITDAQGHAIIEIQIPDDKSNYPSFHVELKYEGSATCESANYSAEASIVIMTWGKIIISILPYIVAAVAVVLGSYLSYRQFVAVPRRRRRQAHIEKIASKYSDLINLQHILVIHSTTGSCIYQHSFGEATFDPDLISGFLTALSAFEGELKIPMPSKTPFGEKVPHKEEASRGFELSYANFKILLNVGHLIRTALILSASPSESLRNSLGEFVDKFEVNYKGELIDWRGAMAPFKTTDKLIEQTFETSLLWPHVIESISEERMKALNSLESSLVTLALTMQREKQYFFLPALVPMLEKVRHTPMVEILGSIDDLRHKGLFKAISIEELEKRLQQTTSNTNTKSQN